jgi:hypothetical protein
MYFFLRETLSSPPTQLRLVLQPVLAMVIQQHIAINHKKSLSSDTGHLRHPTKTTMNH